MSWRTFTRVPGLHRGAYAAVSDSWVAWNSQYLQKHPTKPLAILAGATVMIKYLGSSKEDVENVIFGTIKEPVVLTVKVTAFTLSSLARNEYVIFVGLPPNPFVPLHNSIISLR